MSAEIALLQAAHVLDLAGQLAAENKNFEDILQVAGAWVSIAQTLTTEDDEEQTSGEPPFQMGFSGQIAKPQDMTECDCEECDEDE